MGPCHLASPPGPGRRVHRPRRGGRRPGRPRRTRAHSPRVPRLLRRTDGPGRRPGGHGRRAGGDLRSRRHVLRGGSPRGRDRDGQPQPVRERGHDLHVEREGGPGVPVPRPRGEHRHQRGRRGSRGVLPVRRDEGLLLRRLASPRPRCDPVLHGEQGRHHALALTHVQVPSDGNPFSSRTRFALETWYGNETLYTHGRTYTIAESEIHARREGRGPRGSLRGTRLRSDHRVRGDRLGAQADGPPRPPVRPEAVQRAARGDRHVPELPREDAEGARGLGDRGAEGPPGPARRGRVSPLADGPGSLRDDPGPGAVGGPLGHGRTHPRGDAMSQFTETHEKDLTFKGALEPETGPDPARCPNCGSYALYVDPVRGERVCDNCGFVVDEGLVDLGPDWTTFEGDDRSVAALNRLRRVSRWTRYDRTERALAPGLAQLSSLSARMGLAPAFRERAAILLRRTIEAGLSRGRSMDAIVAAVVYLASKQLGAPRGLHELAQETGVTVHRISLTAKVVSRE